MHENLGAAKMRREQRLSEVDHIHSQFARSQIVANTLFNCRGRGFEICFSIYVPVLNFTVEDEEDEKS